MSSVKGHNYQSDGGGIDSVDRIWGEGGSVGVRVEWKGGWQLLVCNMTNRFSPLSLLHFPYFPFLFSLSLSASFPFELFLSSFSRPCLSHFLTPSFSLPPHFLSPTSLSPSLPYPFLFPSLPFTLPLYPFSSPTQLS